MPETERLDYSSEVFIINATGLSVDIYVNYEAQPTISDPKPLVGEFANKDELTPTEFVVKDEPAAPYGVYTFSVRPKGDPDAEVLAAASVELEQGRSFSGVFHPTPGGGYQFSIYENDLSDAANARLTVRHTARPQEVSWQIRPNGEDPRIPVDERSGSLRSAEWQIATDVTDNDYMIEFFVDGERVALYPDLDLAAGKNIIVYMLGDLPPIPEEQPPGSGVGPGGTEIAELLERPVAFQELEFDPGPVEPDVTTAPAPPLSTTDQNAPIKFTCEPVEVFETNATTTQVLAVDPDGVITNLSIDRVEPKVGGITIPDHGVTPSSSIGEPASAEVTFKSDIPDGAYKVWIVANRGSLAQKASCSLDVTVKSITIARLRSQVSAYRDSGGIQYSVACTLLALLEEAERHLNAGESSQGCQELKEVLDEIGSEKGKGITELAAEDLERETKALRSDLECG